MKAEWSIDPGRFECSLPRLLHVTDGLTLLYRCHPSANEEKSMTSRAAADKMNLPSRIRSAISR
jgi:hypothetical protein